MIVGIPSDWMKVAEIAAGTLAWAVGGYIGYQAWRFFYGGYCGIRAAWHAKHCAEGHHAPRLEKQFGSRKFLLNEDGKLRRKSFLAEWYRCPWCREQIGDYWRADKN